MRKTNKQVIIKKREKGHKTWREIVIELNLGGFIFSQGSSFQATQAMRLYKEVVNRNLEIA